MTPVNNAPHNSANTITGLRAAGDSRLTKTSTPTWMPVRTPSAAPNFAIHTNM